MNALLSRIVQLNRVNVIGVHRNDDGQTYRVLTIARKGNTMAVATAAEFSQLDELIKNTDQRIPVIIGLDGKGILNKQVDFNSETDLNWYKSIDFSTVCHTSLQNGTMTFISFCRKNIADALLETFMRSGFQVADVYVGAFLSALLQPAIGTASVLSDKLSLEFDTSGLVGFTRKEGAAEIPYTIGKDVVTSHFLPLYGMALHFFAPQKTISKTTSEKLNGEEILYRKIFNTFGIAMLAGFLIALLSSYLLIQYYGSKNAELNLQQVYAGESYQKIVELEQQKQQKQQILSDSGFLSSKFLTFFAYEILQGIPSDIVLTQLNITPADKESKPGKKINFESKTIIVKGETYNESAFNDWLTKLKKTDWVRDFEIMKLEKDKKNKSQFEIKITGKDV